MNNKAFTLVELIVVITILSILGTIAFVSLQGYSISARDSIRLTDLQNIEKGLEFMSLKSGRVPIPDDKVDISASGTVISYQGYAGKNVLSQIGISNGGLDPLDQTYYTYATNAGLNKYQLLGYLESGEEISFNSTNQVYADLTNRYPIIKGSTLGIIVNSVNNEPLQMTGTGVDVVNTNLEYKLFLDNNNETTSGTGKILFSKIYNSNESLLRNKYLSQFDDNLVGYWDMETVYNSGGTDYLKDFSKFGNHGGCYNNASVNCGAINGLKLIDGKVGRATVFDKSLGTQQVSVNDSESLNISTNQVTISGWFQLTTPLKDSIDNYPTFLIKRPYQIGGYAAHFFKSAETINIQYCYIGACNTTLKNGFKIGEWYFYTGVKSENTLSIYINGSLVAQNSALNTMETSPGRNLFIGPNFEGVIDEIRLYDRALNSHEISNLYNAMK